MKTSNLKYSATKTVGRETITVKIRLNDECKNGHEDFSATGEVYEVGKPRIDKYMISYGCVHEYILKAFPELKTFVDLHLSDANGVPTHAIANGYYHLRQGFNNLKPHEEGFAAKFCEYYRLNLEQFEALNISGDKDHFGIIVEKIGIRKAWKEQAEEAIQLLEKLTGEEFESKATKSNWYGLSPEEREEVESRIASGYYNPEAIEARNMKDTNGKLEKKLSDLDDELSKKRKSVAIQKKVIKEVFLVGGMRAVDNFIFYTHSNEVNFNWKSYDQLTPLELEKLKNELKLPKGVTMKVDKK
jgi:hypothetical protein